MARLLALAALFLPLTSAFAQGQPITFSAMGDIPYSSSEVPVLRAQIINHNRYSPSEFMVHVGDIKSGTSSCSEHYYRDMVTYLHALAVPTYILPGDNEYNDCSNVSQAWGWWQSYFNDFESTFCGSWPTEHQSVRRENFAFVRSGVLFIGINLVGGRVQSSSEWTQRLQQDATWVQQQFQSKGSQVRAAVIFAQAGPNSSRNTFFTPFRSAASAFGKPILFLHGDGHSWIMDHPFAESNVLRVQVEMGASEDPLQVTVTLDAQNPFLIRRDAFSGSPVVVNMPPCVDAGPDQSVVLPATASLQGAATDDGDPASPGSLSYAWTQVSGPASVAFADAASRNTTATFALAGNYMLRLTANDGALQRSDDVAVTASGQAVAMLAIDDATTLEGNAGGQNAIFTVRRTGSTGQPASVAWATSAGTATAGSDYTTSNGTLDFAADATSLTLHVPVLGDGDDEPNETFLVTLTNPSGAVLGDAQAQGTIQDDDEPAGGGGPPVATTFTPVHDTQVNSSSASTNYGTATTVRIKTDSSHYDAYFKFEITGLTSAVQSAKLRLYCTDTSPAGGSLYRVANEHPNTATPWTETSLRWNNAPPIAGTALATAGAIGSGNWVEYDVTAAITTNGTVAFGLHSGDSDSAYFASKEASSNRPQLVVVPASGPPPPPPPPIALALASFAPASGPVGTVVTLTGTGFTGITGVTFNGLAVASFNVVSSTSVRATVPVGASRGPIAISTSTETATSANEFVITAPAAVASFVALEDAHVTTSSPSSSHGAEQEMRVRAGTPTYYTFVKFTVSGTSGLVQSAKLRLYTTNDGPDGGSVYAVANDFRATTTPWQEETLTWNNAPLISGSALASIGAPPQGAWIEVDVTSAVAGDGTYSFGIKNAAASSVYYQTKEGSNKPVLVVTNGQAQAAATPPASKAEPEPELASRQFEIVGSFPNPSRGRTRFEFMAPRDGTVRLAIYNVRGQMVRRLSEQRVQAGSGHAVWDGRDMHGRAASAGVYFYELEFDRQHRTGKIILER